jgi:acetyl-CoA C-acetyltransferase
MDESTIPVLVGAGQVTQREPDPLAGIVPMDLTAQAGRLAARDAGPEQALLGAIDTLVMIRAFSDTSWRFACPFGQYTHPPKSLAARLGATAAQRLIYTHPGGNMPQWSVNRLCEMVRRGEVGVAMVAGGEALATQKAAQRAKLALDWSGGPGRHTHRLGRRQARLERRRGHPRYARRDLRLPDAGAGHPRAPGAHACAASGADRTPARTLRGGRGGQPAGRSARGLQRRTDLDARARAIPSSGFPTRG